MAIIYLIRHGKTAGNREGRYVGSTDEPLCEEGIREVCAYRDALMHEFTAGDICEICINTDAQMHALAAKDRERRQVKTVYVSPMLRCRQTAELFFPHVVQEIVDDFREMDFGEFEYKNYKELAGDLRYQAFIDSGGSLDFPGAEPQQQFRQRVRYAFARCIKNREALMMNSDKDSLQEPLVFMVHGGTIMAILEAYAQPHRSYFDWQIAPACGYRCELTYTKDGFMLENVTLLFTPRLRIPLRDVERTCKSSQCDRKNQ